METATPNRREPCLARNVLGYIPAGVLLALVFLVYKDYGITWDERVQSEYGERALGYYFSGGADVSYLKVGNLKYYGALFETSAALAYGTGSLGKYETRRLLCALMGVLTVAGVARLGGMIGGPPTALAGAMALALNPAYFGQMFVNSKDVPFAALFTWSMIYLAMTLSPGGAVWRNALASGLCVGLAAGVRPAGLMPLMIMAGGGALFSFSASGKAAPRKSLTVKLSCAFLLAWMVMAALWPFAHGGWFNAIIGIKEALRFSTSYQTLFMGENFRSDQLPWYYLPVNLLITTPPAILILAGAGAISGALSLTRPYSGKRMTLFLALFWFFFPVAYCMVARPNIYDGIRHFIFILPAMAVLAGYGASLALDLAGAWIGRPAAAAAIAAALLAPSVELVRLHPYQYAYFNFLVGGVAGADGRYETEYWTSSYKEAIEWLAQNGAPAPGGKVKVLVAANSFNKICAQNFAPPWMEVVTTEEALGGLIPPPGVAGGDLPTGFGYYLATYRYGMSQAFPAAVIEHIIGGEGAVFAVIKKARRRP